MSGVRLAAGLALLAAAVSHPTPASEGRPLSLRVSVATSLAPAIREAVDRYPSVKPEVEVQLSSGASGVLLQQVRRGAPVDLLISASPDEIDRLVAARLALGPTRRRIAANRLVVVVPSGAAKPATLEELARPDFDLIALGSPKTAPVGRYARDALRAHGLWQRLEARHVLAASARQVLEYVARGDVAAGLAYRTDALLLPDRVTIALEVPIASHAPIFYEGVVIVDAAQPEAATAFLDWLGTESGRAPLVRRGFLIPRQ